MSGYRIVGVDPGLHGALGFFDPEFPGLCSAEDFPSADGELVPAQIAKMLETMRPTVAVVEDVHAMPTDSASSAFAFGRNVGVVLGVLGSLRIPVHFVRPQAWKSHFKIKAPAATTAKEKRAAKAAAKEMARSLVLQQFPASADYFQRKLDADRAEAVLIARYGHEVLGLGRL
jgi:hypothetical protein